jgi:hypothetical protein
LLTWDMKACGGAGKAAVSQTCSANPLTEVDVWYRVREFVSCDKMWAQLLFLIIQGNLC